MSVPPPPERTWLPLVELAIAEDLGPGDATSPLVIEASRTGTAVIEAREGLVACGLFVAERVFRAIDPAIRFEARVAEGESARPGDRLAVVRGPLRSLLAAERTALNFLARTSGVATHAKRFVEAVAGTGARIVDTRKTLPGWRSLDKYAAAIGGAHNHRIGLFDGILLKDNHVAAGGGVAQTLKSALAHAPANLLVQIEVESFDDAVAAVEGGAGFLLLDNCEPDEIRRIVDRLGDRAVLEASGGVSLANVRDLAETGVHRISIGALTHSAPAVDVALEVEAGAPGGGPPPGIVGGEA